MEVKHKRLRMECEGGSARHEMVKRNEAGGQRRCKWKMSKISRYKRERRG